MPIHETQIYTVAEVAELFHVERNRVYAWIRSGWLRGFRVSPEARQNLIMGKAVLELIGKLEEGKYAAE